MRIGIDARFYSSASTGIGRYVYELIDNVLRLDDHNHYVLFFNHPHFDEFKPKRQGVEKILAASPHYSWREQWHFCRVLKHAKLDLMHFTHFNAPILYRDPSIVTIHDLTLHKYPGNKMDSFWQRLGYEWSIHSITRRAKKIIAVSKHTKNDIIELLRAKKEKIVVIHEGVAPQFHPIADKNVVSEFCKRMGFTKPYILYTGVWRSHKNLVNLIKAFALLKNHYHFEGFLVITGKEDPWYPEVKQTVASEHLEGEVRFTGLVPEEDLVLLYNGALLYVLPSLYEGFGLPALEAMACGVPVCAARSSSLPEICGEGNAVFFDPNNVSDIASKISSVYNNHQKILELQNRGLKRAKGFSWEKMARETLKLYNEILYPNA